MYASVQELTNCKKVVDDSHVRKTSYSPDSF
jgi:hypothetical protein